MADDRPLRICDICYQVDTDPRHDVAGPDDPGYVTASQDVIERITDDDSLPIRVRVDAIRSLEDRTRQIAHMDCCADSGRCDGTCAAQLAAAKGNGPKLVTHLLNQQAELNDDRERAS
jgi:hypothetical protein